MIKSYFTKIKASLSQPKELRDNKTNNIILFVFSLAVILSMFFIFDFSNSYRGVSAEADSVKTKITEIQSDEYYLTNGYGGDQTLTREVIFKAKILEGDHKGKFVLVTQLFDETAQMSYYPPKVGDKIFVTLLETKGDIFEGFAQDYVRDIYVFMLIAIFLLALVAFGKMKGYKTALSLVITCIFLFGFFIPMLLEGYNPVFLSLLTSLFIIVTTLVLVIGINKKSISATIGCFGGLMMAFFLGAIMQRFIHLTGLIDEDSALLIYSSPDGYLNLKGIVLSSIIIGALGATMDVSISIASSLDEIISKAPEISATEIMHSGINIGRDIMGTMANTLLLAYVGSSLQSILLIFSAGFSFRQMINREMIATEVLQAICGSVGLLLTIPITALCVSLLHKYKKQ
ncbi:MAG: YibE/F family protein [Oscillospiraceae bacterium]